MKKIGFILIFVLLFFACSKKSLEVNFDETSDTKSVTSFAEDVKNNQNQKIEIGNESIKDKNHIAIINDTNVRLRTEPNLESETITLLNSGEELIVLDQSAEKQKIGDMEDYWYKVRASDFGEAWIYGHFLDITDDSEIVWKDSAFEADVRRKLKKTTGPIMQSEVRHIESISLDWNVVELDNIIDFTSLTNLGFSHSRGRRLLEDITPLSEMYNLEVLQLGLASISNIQPLAGLMNLQRLQLTGNQISNIESLSALEKLTTLRLNGNQISDINPLINLSKLHFLDASSNQIQDLKALGNLSALKELNLAKNRINDTSPLSSLTGLEELFLSENYIDNIDGLRNLTDLVVLDLDENNITDIIPLSNLTKIKKLHLRNNEISDISLLADLQELEEVDLRDNPITDISILGKLPNLKKLGVDELVDISFIDINKVKIVSDDEYFSDAP